LISNRAGASEACGFFPSHRYVAGLVPERSDGKCKDAVVTEEEAYYEEALGPTIDFIYPGGEQHANTGPSRDERDFG
jgi:hypothetical protein